MTNYIKIGNREIGYHRISNNGSGHPRYVIHYLALELADHEATALTRRHGFRKYTARWYGGGFAVATFNLESTLERYFDELEEAIK